ncbi:uncharacterized protein B0H18DRAFT_1053302, partial [Fomitopsis serialis]|uniref:uncharacterized protein n=1 Tax=Fomitopsis serialis TaxID=139415 RepID=UPI0020084404
HRCPPADHFQKRPRVVRDDDYDDRSSDSSGFHGRDGQHDSRNGRDTVRVRDPRDKEDNTRYGRDPRSGHDAEYSRGDSGNGNGTEPEDEDDVESLIMTDRSPLGKLIRAMRATEHTDQEKLILKPWKKAARFIPRCMGPFINLNNVILCGIHFGGLMPEEWDLTDFKSLDVKEIPRHIEYYESLLNLIPQLEEVLQQAQGNREIVGVISHFFEKHLKQARSDDSTKVKNSVLTFIPKNLDNVPNIEQDHEKHQRGFRHLATGRLLTPAAIQWKFNADPQRREGYFADNPEAGLLKAPLISAVYRAIMTGPKTGKAPLAHFSSTSRSGPGRKSLAKEYGITACVPETIAYATTLVSTSRLLTGVASTQPVADSLRS